VRGATCCPRCGGTSPGVGRSGLCPSCLLGLALGTDDGSECDEQADGPAPVYRVLTILASEPDRTTYLAEQDETRRLVTLDVVRIGRAPGDEDPAWLGDRLRALTRWVHPGVPRVIDGRTTPSGDFCVVTDYASGPALDRHCETHRLDGQSRARLFARVCDIVSDGHRHGVCHGRLRSDLVIASVAHDEVVPLVLGYSMLSDRVPTVEDDLPGLEGLARAMGWQCPLGHSWRSVDGLLAAASSDWPMTAAAEPHEGNRG
jgi:hypothetical protein